MNKKKYQNTLSGLVFLSPNILGFLVFTLIPLFLSLAMAFTNWDLKLHNMFKDEQIKFTGLDNFVRLLSHPDFYRFFGNTMFFMIGIPFSVIGSLILALFLSKDLKGGKHKYALLVISIFMVVSFGFLAIIGLGPTAMTILLAGVVCMILSGGVLGGTTFYRTIMYIPSFTSGVAVFILWKKLYNPYTGPINLFLTPILKHISNAVNFCPSLPSWGFWLFFLLLSMIVFYALLRLGSWWQDGDIGDVAIILPFVIIFSPVVMAYKWLPIRYGKIVLLILVILWVIYTTGRILYKKRKIVCSIGYGFGNAVMFALVIMFFELIILGFSIVFYKLPIWVAIPGGLMPPHWLTNYYWAKPALMMMGLWSSIGSQNMLLYIAAMSNVPVELYEASDIDGASGLQKFWNITWPQLAPTTFFILVMSVIGGLQSGFEMARTMTAGGPAGSTTMLSYFIYTEGFTTGRLGYASAVAWTLFFMILLITMFNWKIGSKYVNE